MADDSNPSNPVPDGGGSAPAGGGENAATLSGLSLEEINRTTGRNYADLPTALRGIQETFKFVGAPKANTDGPAPTAANAPAAAAPAAVDTSKLVTQEQFAESEFFRDNAEANKHRDLLKTIAKANGMSPQELFAADPATIPAAKLFRDTVASVVASDEVKSARSALTSSSRLGIVSDDFTKATENFENSQRLRASGDVTGADRAQRAAESHALQAVIKASKLEGQSIVD